MVVMVFLFSTLSFYVLLVALGRFQGRITVVHGRRSSGITRAEDNPALNRRALIMKHFIIS